ncbi:MAG: winged helix DNA-binding domain-containing protein, partial [Anaerolineae bacterium]|nr:winged helix DNA-binding domain-containing protein [Anaerolineae bacterium]
NEEKVLWSWGSATSMARASLEYLHSIGKIGIHDKVGTRRIFDLVERLIPAEILAQEEPYPETKDYHDWHILRRVGSKGITSLRAGEHWLGIRRAKASERRAGIARLTEKGELLPIAVEGLSETFYIRTQDRDILEKALKGRAPKAKAAFIAPLDNFMWDRTLIKDLFDFEYIWEVYKPKNTRQYGYYVLPVLYGDQIVGRIEPKLDRKTNILWINNWWWEAGFKPDAETLSALRECLLHFQKYLGAAEIKLGEPLQGKRTFTWIKVKG